MFADVLVVGSGISAYFCAKSLKNPLVISNSKSTNSVNSYGAFRTAGNGDASLLSLIKKIGQGLSEEKKLTEFCAFVPKLKLIPEFKEVKPLDCGFCANLSFLNSFSNDSLAGTLENILVEDGVFKGAVFNFKGRTKIIYAKAMILCSGGFSSFFKNPGSSDYGIALPIELAFLSGAHIANLEFNFFHPFGLNGKCVPTESLSSFDFYFPDGKRASEIDAAIRAKKAHTLLSSFSEQIFKSGGFVTAKSASDEIRFSPVSHYSLGGLLVDENCMTNIKGLFAAGESVTGINGADRVGGTALPESVFLGIKAGTAAGKYIEELVFSNNFNRELCAVSRPSVGFCSGDILKKHFAIVNSKTNLKAGLEAAKLNDSKFCEALFSIALKRKESRGCFKRSDFPIKKSSFLHSFSAHMSKNGRIVTSN